MALRVAVARRRSWVDRNELLAVEQVADSPDGDGGRPAVRHGRD
jgi:hypothetical protein